MQKLKTENQNLQERIKETFIDWKFELEIAEAEKKELKIKNQNFQEKI